MHISEGFLPWTHAAGWTLISAPCFVYSLRCASVEMAAGPEARLRLAAAAGFLFALSALKLPSFAGSCSHATGVALGAILIGPAVMPALAFVVLLFQALILAHGGVTSLGANLFSLGVVGPMVAWLIAGSSTPSRARAFLAGFVGSLCVYAATSAELALAFPDAAGGVSSAFARFAGLFAITQVPISAVEGIVTAVVVATVNSYTQSPGGLTAPREVAG
ncbi:MAG: energy-coupling factor ABC transporter permease [Acidobacteria bacterium]|nr:energy-coupling factor ABC transporter permease [Acidobacteriota bacterium]